METGAGAGTGLDMLLISPVIRLGGGGLNFSTAKQAASKSGGFSERSSTDRQPEVLQNELIPHVLRER